MERTSRGTDADLKGGFFRSIPSKSAAGAASSGRTRTKGSRLNRTETSPTVAKRVKCKELPSTVESSAVVFTPTSDVPFISMEGGQLMQDQQTERFSETCAACGGYPGGIIWEGVVLSGVLTAHDIVVLVRGALPYRSVVRLFTTGQLRGTRPGKVWQIRASQFVKDWDSIERSARALPMLPAARQIVEAIAR